MRVLIATDAWRPQLNGVVRTYEQMHDHLVEMGVELAYVTPSDFRSFPCPSYPEIRLALTNRGQLARRIAEFAPDAIHLATEGPVGWAVRRWCRQNGFPFTTSFHTRFPEYVHSRVRLPVSWSYAWLRRFHNSGAGVMVASPTLSVELGDRGFLRILRWTKGIDSAVFKPSTARLFGEGPVFLYVGRVAVEKNIDAFLSLDLPGRKVVVGDGPMREELMSRHRDVVFTGRKTGQELADCFASGDVFVFPSLTDTFGIVLLEAMASGLPAAAFPVVGPRDVVVPGVTGVLDADLRRACLAALELDRSQTRQHALPYTWVNTARMFISNIEKAYVAAGRKTTALPASSVSRSSESGRRV